MNSAESSIINNFYQILSNTKSPSYSKRIKTPSKNKLKVKDKTKPEIVESEKEMGNPAYGLESIVDEKTKILILETFPAQESIDENFYYQNQNKRFWGKR